MASLDLPGDVIGRSRLRGRGHRGPRGRASGGPCRAPISSTTPRVRFRELPRAERAALDAGRAPARGRPGDRRHRASSAATSTTSPAAEEELLLALADQAAIALEHARLLRGAGGAWSPSARASSTAQKRFVEVVLETLPLGVFVLDAGLRVVRANREGARVLGCDAGDRAPFPSVVTARREAGDGRGLPARRLRRRATCARSSTSWRSRGEPKTLPAHRGAAGAARRRRRATWCVLVEDITRAKQLERQMLLTERLTTAGRLAAGVAHELNNPLATIAGCAEALLGATARRTRSPTPAELADFRGYLGLIEEEAYRCKEITGSLLQFVREPGSRRAPTDVNALVLKTIELLSHQSRFVDGTLRRPSSIPRCRAVTVNEGQLRQVFLGMAANALEAMEGRGRLTDPHAPGAATRSRSSSRTRARGSPTRCCRASSIPSSPPSRRGRAPASDSPSRRASSTDHGGRIEVHDAAVAKGSIFRVVLPA